MSTEVELPEILDLESVPKLRECLAGALSEQSEIQIDAGKVERIGTPAVQVLLAAAAELAGEKRRLVLTGSSSVFQSAFEDLGLSSQYAEWSKS
ncbi:STAS domain-containing protein [Roseibium sp. Sym1]|uniref:STAS domain-containing protein n=1 Tax=Roseibium sp. Sym1 TaxID=3016006 RepID=UPI0022B37822|nr:STAS domain-containing protein [Roseibium sp. Sym1]